MTARLVALAVACLAPAAAFAQHFHQHLEATPDDAKRISVCKKPYAPPRLDPDIQKTPWPVHTTNADAQKFFEQGMTLLYGFNYEDAMRNFQRASELDPSFALAHWGIALAAGPNINIAMDSPCGKLAFEESRRARHLADEQKGSIPPLELALAHALPARYPTDVVEPVDYAVAMRSVWTRFAPDPNVGALYAESLFNLRPWGLFDNALRPAIDTDVALQVLEDVLKAAPDHIGANHYWLHAVEAGPNPELAERSADVLFTGVPASGHLLHMPSHTYFEIGDFARAVDANAKGIAVDNAQFGEACKGSYDDYVKNPACLQLYYGHYLAHNYFFKAVSETFLGRYAAAGEDARTTRAHVERFVANEPGLQRYMTAPLMLYAASGDWAAILREPEPPETCYMPAKFTATGCRILRSIWHWARGQAYVSRADPDVEKADGELDEFLAERARIPHQGPTGWGNNNAAAVLLIAEEVLRARIAWAEGKRESAIEHLKLAVTHEDALVYDEPPQWFHPVRQSLGGAYLTVGNAAAAKAVFAQDLERHHENGRSLFGLATALEQLGDPSWEEQWKAYLAAWNTADAPYRELTVDALWLLGMPKDPAPAPEK